MGTGGQLTPPGEGLRWRESGARGLRQGTQCSEEGSCDSAAHREAYPATPRNALCIAPKFEITTDIVIFAKCEIWHRISKGLITKNTTIETMMQRDRESPGDKTTLTNP